MNSLKKMLPVLQALQEKIPGATLVPTKLPQCPEVSLYLLEDSYPQKDLTADQVSCLMDDPPYWAFCWASGQVLSRYILDHPEKVRNRVCVDFGCGSAVVGIAAMMAGAAKVWAIDADRAAREIAQINANLNGVELQTSAKLGNGGKHQADILFVADVFYDESNLELLNLFNEQFPQIIAADSRVAPEKLMGMKQVKTVISHTVPDLDESAHFNSVRIYRN